jgi:hypothetical protein
MKYFVDAFYSDGRPLLGNMDGQTIIKAKIPTRTEAWKRIKYEDLSKLTTHKEPITYKLMDPYGNVCEIVERKPGDIGSTVRIIRDLRVQWNAAKKEGKTFKVHMKDDPRKDAWFKVTGLRVHPRYGDAEFQTRGCEWTNIHGAPFEFKGE